jgi:type IV secretion system protein VirB9
MRRIIFLIILSNTNIYLNARAQDQLAPYLEKIQQEEKIRKEKQLIEQQKAMEIIKNKDANVNVPEIKVQNISDTQNENKSKKYKNKKTNIDSDEYYEEMYSNNIDKYSKIERSKPILKNGIMYFTFDEGTPSVICSPVRICDLQLESGETITNLQIGDSTRWIVEVLNSDGIKEAHVIIKPVTDKLKTNMIIATDKRQYNINIKSDKKKYYNKVAYFYPSKANKLVTVFDSIPEKSKFDYYIRGDKTTWTPLEVKTDGRKTYIKLPDKFKYSPTLPVLYSLDDDGVEAQVSNSRLYKNWIIADVMINQGVLKAGVGTTQKKIIFTRKGTVGLLSRLFNSEE